MQDELEALVVDGQELDRKLVAQILSPYVRLDRAARDIRPLDGWDSLNAKQQILVYLLARKAMVALDFGLEEEGATPTEVSEETGLKSGTAKPRLRTLLSDRVISQDQRKRYFVPNYALAKVRQLLVES